MSSILDNKIIVKGECQHRFCTCDVYTSGTNSANTWSSEGKCSLHTDQKTINGETYNSQHDQQRSTLSCYSYTSKLICSQHSTKCYPYGTNGQNEQPYKCPGHRNEYQNKSITFINYAAGSIIDDLQFNKIQEYIRKEIAERKLHAAYSQQDEISYNDQDVISGDIIYANQPTAINNALNNLRTRIHKLNDAGHSIQNKYPSVHVGDKVKADDIKKLESDLNNRYTDCVCYSDCIGYGAWKYINCTCNVNCKCNY